MRNDRCITMALHTWGQNLGQHIHVHSVITGGGLTNNGQWKRCKKNFLFPVRALSKVFRGKYLEKLKSAFVLVLCFSRFVLVCLKGKECTKTQNLG